MVYQYEKQINTDKLLFEIAQASLPAPQRIDTVDEVILIHFLAALSTEQENTLQDLVAAHQPSVPLDALKYYMRGHVMPFVENMMCQFVAENIAMGVTELGKTGPVLGMFRKPLDVNSDGFSFSLKDTFDTGSLKESIKIIQYLRDNPVEYEGLEPFISDSRLLGMQNKIETFLGLPLSE